MWDSSSSFQTLLRLHRDPVVICRLGVFPRGLIVGLFGGTSMDEGGGRLVILRSLGGRLMKILAWLFRRCARLRLGSNEDSHPF